MLPAANGTDQRLDALIQQQSEILAELRALRADLQRSAAPVRPVESGGVVELREPRRNGRRERG